MRITKLKLKAFQSFSSCPPELFTFCVWFSIFIHFFHNQREEYRAKQRIFSFSLDPPRASYSQFSLILLCMMSEDKRKKRRWRRSRKERKELEKVFFSSGEMMRLNSRCFVSLCVRVWCGCVCYYYGSISFSIHIT